MTSEWQTEHLDLDAYRRRIGHTGPLAADRETLTALHRAHLAAIPFENLDVILGREVAVDLEHVQAKLVNRQRGGYCYEQNMLFGAVVERLGFPVRRLLARVGDPDEKIAPRSHLVLRVMVDDEPWLADVGFGSGLLEPIPLAEAGPQRQGDWEYELHRGPDATWRLSESKKTFLSFTEDPHHFVDVDQANFWTSHHPRSRFVRGPVVMREDSTSVRSLIGREYRLERPGHPTEKHRLTDEEFAGLLRSDFAPVLGEEEIAGLVSRLPVIIRP